jgi:hypothetical protein
MNKNYLVANEEAEKLIKATIKLSIKLKNWLKSNRIDRFTEIFNIPLQDENKILYLQLEKPPTLGNQRLFAY